MIVDDKVTLSGQSPPPFTQLNTDNNPLYIGGLSPGFSPSSLIRPGSHQRVCSIRAHDSI